MNKYIKHYGYIAYTIFMIILAILSIRYDFFIWRKSFEIIGIILYYIMSFIGLYSFIKAEKSRGSFLIMSMLSGIILTSKLILLIPIALLVVNSFNPTYKFVIRVVLPHLLIVLLIRFSFGFVHSDFVVISEYRRVVNSEGNCEFIIYEHDQGALGIDYSLYIKKNYFDLVSVQKRLKLIDRSERVWWIDKDTLGVGLEELEVN